MLGTLQQSSLRIEVDATAARIRESLVQPANFRRWLWPQQFSEGLPHELTTGFVFKSYLGPVEIRHTVSHVDATQLLLLTAGGIDGFHEWYWGDGWVQSRLEGVSVLPLNLGQSVNLWRLKQFLALPEDIASADLS